MEQNELPHNAPAAPPTVPKGKTNLLSNRLHRATFGLTAEYSIFLISLGVVLSNLSGLIYMFFGLIVDAMHSHVGSSIFPAHIFALWLLISSVVTLPLVVILSARIRGQLTESKETDLPKGAAKGFRTFWIIVTVLTIIGLKIAAVYAPIAALVTGGLAVELLLSVTVPSLVSAVILWAGVYLVTRPVGQQSKSKILLWTLMVLTVLLFTVNYLWSYNVHKSRPTPTIPSYTEPLYQDPYLDQYDYYDYSDPNSTYR